MTPNPIGDMVSGQPDVRDNHSVPNRPAIVVPVTLGTTSGDMVSGAQPPSPDLGPVEWNENGSPADPQRQL